MRSHSFSGIDLAAGRACLRGCLRCLLLRLARWLCRCFLRLEGQRRGSYRCCFDLAGPWTSSQRDGDASRRLFAQSSRNYRCDHSAGTCNAQLGSWSADTSSRRLAFPAAQDRDLLHHMKDQCSLSYQYCSASDPCLLVPVKLTQLVSVTQDQLLLLSLLCCLHQSLLRQ